ncbi:glycosyltransferase [Arundinibacter roseus]|uniref:Glycosyltransferase n=1 Tax=Arundinibacter roseus TaxID=2070510 RepID=A0A4R4K7X0_9BACT|nr:glycosyltransferase [Arundinibacter roseus]TDB63453.1 glycosyltransferase [Arundinibacter roseus]
MTEPLLILLLTFASIQLVYYLFIFTRLIRYEQPDLEPATSNAVGVSVLVCAWNELENLKELLPLLDAQDYPTFEVLVLDDRSSDGTDDFLKESIAQWSHVRYIRIDNEHAHITPKKYAITMGMKHARYPVALMTDADCRPAGSDWIASMAAQLVDRKEIVLGFSPYFKEKGVLNWFIRCETFFTAVQYFSLALAGRPYMGVGRNLMYHTSLFFAHRGFYKHKDIVGGDDDLFMNQAARTYNTSINLDPESFVYSYAKSSWKAWYRQKKRHLSVGKYYKTSNKIRLGILSASHTGLWLTGIVALIWGIYTQDLLLLQTLAGVFVGRWLIQLFVLQSINKRLDRTVEWFLFIFMDMAFFLYYLIMSGLVFSRKKKKIQWR